MDTLNILALNAQTVNSGIVSAAKTYSGNATFRTDLTNAMAGKASSSTRASSAKRGSSGDSVTVYSASATSENADTKETVTTPVSSDDDETTAEAQATMAASVLADNWGLRVNDILNSAENIANAYQKVSENLALGSMLSGPNGFNFMADQFGITPEELYKISSELFANAKADLMENSGKYTALELEGGASFTIKAATDGSTSDQLAVASIDAEQTASASASALLQSDNISGSGGKSEANASKSGTNSFASNILAAFKPDVTIDLSASAAELTSGAELSSEVRQDIVDSMLDNIQSAVSAQKSTLRVQLKPEVLGGIEIELTMTSEGINAQMRTNNQQVQALLNTELTQLMDSLRQRGVQINQLDVVYSQMASGDMMFQSGDGRNDGAWADDDNKAALAAARATRRASELLDAGYATDAYEDLSTYDADEQDAAGVVYDA